MADPMVRRIGALLAAIIGGYLMNVALTPTTGVGTAFVSFLVGLVLWMAVAAILVRFYTPGTDQPSADEVGVAGEWRVARFLRRGRDAAPLYLGLRLFAGYEWITAGWHKFQDPKWIGTGESLRAYWERAAAIPQQGSPAITYPAYRAFIQSMLDHHWEVWFGKVITCGELLVGLGLLVGGLTAIAAFFGLLMNFSYVFAGSTASNPALIILAAVIIYGWRVAGWWGLDRLLLPYLGTPWGRGETAPRPATMSPATT